MNGLSSLRATALPIVVLPTPGSPTRMRCGRVLATFSVTQRFHVTRVIATSLSERISAKLLEKRLSDNERCHGFGDYSHRWNGRDITSFRHCLCRLARFHFDRPQRTHQRAYRLHRCSQHELLPGADASLHASRPIAAAANTARLRVAFISIDLVVHLRALPSRALDAQADLDALDRGNGHQRCSEPAIELSIPRDMGAQP